MVDAVAGPPVGAGVAVANQGNTNQGNANKITNNLNLTDADLQEVVEGWMVVGIIICFDIVTTHAPIAF